jgi:hypothetical protein
LALGKDQQQLWTGGCGPALRKTNIKKKTPQFFQTLHREQFFTFPEHLATRFSI